MHPTTLKGQSTATQRYTQDQHVLEVSIAIAKQHSRSWRFRRDIVDYPVDTLDLVGDPRRNLLEDSRGEDEPDCVSP